MPVATAIPCSMIRRRRRWDSSYYEPQFIDIEQAIRRCPRHLTLGQLTTRLFAKGIFDINAGEYVTAGVPFIRISNLRDGLIDTEDLTFITPERSAADAKTELTQFDLVLSKTAYAAASLVQLPRCNVSQDCIAVKTDRDMKFNCFLAAFLNCRFGLPQMDRLFQGNVQAHLGLNETREILVPDPDAGFLSEIESLMLGAVSERERFLACHGSALRQLESALRLDQVPQLDQLGYSTRFRDVAFAHRWDSQHYRPEFAALFDVMVAALGTDQVRPLWQIVTFNQRGKQPVYVEGGPVAVVNSQHIGPQHIRFDELASTSQAIYDDDERSRLTKNDVVVYATGAYVGRTNIWLEDMPAVASNHVNILRVKPEYDPAYVALVLNSKVGAMQTEKHGTGSTQVELYPANLAKFLIPILDPKKQREIGDKVRQSYDALKQSKTLLEQAKRRVEELIEQEAQA